MRPTYTVLHKAGLLSVGGLWTLLERTLLSKEAPQIQRDEMRRAFFIGFTECFAVMNDLSENLSEDDAAKVLSKLNDEVSAFHAKEIHRIIPNKGSA